MGVSVLPDEGEGVGGGLRGGSFLPAGSYLTSSVNMPTEKQKRQEKAHNKRPAAHPAKIKARPRTHSHVIAALL